MALPRLISEIERPKISSLTKGSGYKVPKSLGKRDFICLESLGKRDFICLESLGKRDFICLESLMQ